MSLRGGKGAVGKVYLVRHVQTQELCVPNSQPTIPSLLPPLLRLLWRLLSRAGERYDAVHARCD